MTNLSDYAASLSVLYLDSDRQWLNIIRRELMGTGIGEVLTTTDPKEALTQIRNAEIDILITHNDLKIVRFLRHHDASPDREIPIIMVASNIDPSDIASMRDAGVDEIAVKPCSISQLVQRIEAVASHPRKFVVSGKFTGPSRRRKKIVSTDRNDGPNSSPIHPTNVRLESKADHFHACLRCPFSGGNFLPMVVGFG